MNDVAHEWTDKQLETLERNIAREYRKAVKELKQKQAEALKDYGEELKAMRKDLEKGVITNEQFNTWLQGQAVSTQLQNELIETLSETANNANRAAVDMVNNSIPKYYAENYNWGTYTIENGASINTMFNLVDVDTVKHLLLENPSLIPVYKLDNLKDIRWNNKKFASAITQGILQGESIPKIAKRLELVMQMNHNSAVRNARTATTAAENKGRVDSYKRAEGMGIEIKKEWLATLDGRTRHSHRQLDGVSVGTDDKFDNGCRYPGDPQGPAQEVYNCRCTLIAKVEGIDTSNAPRFERLDGMTYKEWKRGHRRS